jgi:hypothetical protein
MHLRLILLIVTESIRRLIGVQIKFRYILMIRDSRLQKLLNRERFSIVRMSLIGRISVMLPQLEARITLVQMDSNLHYSGLLDLKERHRDRRIARLRQTYLALCREYLSIGKTELITQNFLLHRENREEIMPHGGIMPLSRLRSILILL